MSFKLESGPSPDLINQSAVKRVNDLVKSGLSQKEAARLVIFERIEEQGGDLSEAEQTEKEEILKKIIEKEEEGV